MEKTDAVVLCTIIICLTLAVIAMFAIVANSETASAKQHERQAERSAQGPGVSICTE